MKTLSQEIVTINTKITNHSREMSRLLLDMDASARKYSLLRTEGYLETFYAASKAFEEEYTELTMMLKPANPPQSFIHFQRQYEDYLHNQTKNNNSALGWVTKETSQNWLNSLVDLHDSNREAINHSLLSIHDQAQYSIKNGLYGLSFSIIAAFFGVWFISKSIIIPLKQLTSGLRDLSQGREAPAIHVSSQDEFRDLAIAYNEMSSELREQENLRADFIAALSHEIRTPLSSIQESVSLIVEELMGPITGRQRKLLQIAIEELKRLRELLNHLMHTSLLEVSSTEKASQSINPLQLVNDCLTLLTPSANQKNIDLQVHTHDLPDTFFGYREEIQQVLINIIGNAIKFSPERSEVLIDIKQLPKDLLTINVSDTGPGIDESEQQLIFKKYYRSKSVRKHMNGVGLGLFISQKIIHNAGGNLTVKNNRQRGCTFTLSIPSKSHS